MRIFFTGIIACMVVFAANHAFAEGFFDIYAGPSFTDTATVKVSSNVAVKYNDVSFKGETTYGLRGGYWLRNVPWLGFGGDFSSLHARGNKTKFDLVPLTAMAYFRLPLLTDEEVPQGRIQPYVGIGPSISFYTYAQTDPGAPTSVFSGTDSGIRTGKGFQLPAGIAVQLSRRVALFAEYRYAYYAIDISQDNDYPFIQSQSAADNQARKLETDLSIHNVLLGLSFRFGN